MRRGGGGWTVDVALRSFDTLRLFDCFFFGFHTPMLKMIVDACDACSEVPL
jgi:hypothetical protein